MGPGPDHPMGMTLRPGLVHEDGLTARLDQQRIEVSASLPGLELPLIGVAAGLAIAFAVR